MELLIAMGVGVIIVVGATSAFSRAFGNYRKAQEMQKDIETARVALSLMAKEMRMSYNMSVASAFSGGMGVPSVRFFSSSRRTCIKYSFSGGKLYANENSSIFSSPFNSFSDPPKCLWDSTYPASSETEIAGADVTGSFDVVNTNRTLGSYRIGWVTVKMTIGSGSSAQHMQTTVSFRDFSGILQ